MSELTNKKCVPCEGNLNPLSNTKEDEYLKDVPDWEINREGEHFIRREFKFKNFKQAMKFVNNVADIAEEEGHHPDIYIYYNRVELKLYTHAIHGLFINDFIMAAKIDEIFGK